MFWVKPNLGEPCFAVGIGSGARPLGMSQTGNYSRNENWCETVDTPLSPLHPASFPLPPVPCASSHDDVFSSSSSLKLLKPEVMVVRRRKSRARCSGLGARCPVLGARYSRDVYYSHSPLCSIANLRCLELFLMCWIIHFAVPPLTGFATPQNLHQ